jgi:hypothetical protein
MAGSNKQFETRFTLKATDQASATIQSVKRKLRSLFSGTSGPGEALNQIFARIGQGAQQLTGTLSGGLTGVLTNTTGQFGSTAVAVGQAGAAISAFAMGSMGLGRALSSIVNFLKESKAA